MKITHIIQRYAPSIGGSEKWCEEICEYISRKGCSVKILTHNIYNIKEFYAKSDNNSDHFKLSAIQSDGAILIKRYKILKLSKFFHLLFNETAIFRNTIFGIFIRSPISFRMYLGILKELIDCDIVHLHTLPYFHNFVGLLAAKILRKKTVLTPHFHVTHPHYENKLLYWLMKQCDGILTMSEYEKRYLITKGIGKEKIYTIGNCIRPELYNLKKDLFYRESMFQRYGIGAKSKIIIFIGARHETKGLKNLISAVKELIEEGRDIFLFLAGPNDESSFRSYYSTLSRQDKKRIIDLGIIPHGEKVNLLYLSNVLVLPSAYEAFGIVFLEAWICGKPVIATERGAMPHIVAESGLICKYGDVASLKEKITFILEDEFFAAQLGREGRKKVMENYTWEEIGEKVYKVYTAVNKL